MVLYLLAGRGNVAASETFGNLNVLGGHNIVTLTPNGAGGTVTVTAAATHARRRAPRSRSAPTTLGASSKLFVNGTLPAADATGILPRIVSNADFLTYTPPPA